MTPPPSQHHHDARLHRLHLTVSTPCYTQSTPCYTESAPHLHPIYNHLHPVYTHQRTIYTPSTPIYIHLHPIYTPSTPHLQSSTPHLHPSTHHLYPIYTHLHPSTPHLHPIRHHTIHNKVRCPSSRRYAAYGATSHHLIPRVETSGHDISRIKSNKRTLIHAQYGECATSHHWSRARCTEYINKCTQVRQIVPAVTDRGA